MNKLAKSDLGWDLLIVQRLVEGYGYVDSKTGKMYVWMNGVGEQEVSTTLINMLEHLKYLKKLHNESNEQGEDSARFEVGGLAG